MHTYYLNGASQYYYAGYLILWQRLHPPAMSHLNSLYALSMRMREISYDTFSGRLQDDTFQGQAQLSLTYSSPENQKAEPVTKDVNELWQ